MRMLFLGEKGQGKYTFPLTKPETLTWFWGQGLEIVPIPELGPESECSTPPIPEVPAH